MKIEVQKSFEKDIAKVSDKSLARKVLDLLKDLEIIESLADIPKLKKLHAKGNLL